MSPTSGDTPGSQGHWQFRFLDLIPLFALIRFVAPTAAMGLALSALALCKGSLAATSSDGLSIHWVAHFSGAVLVAFVVACVSASVFEAVSRVRVAIGPRDAVPWGLPPGIIQRYVSFHTSSQSSRSPVAGWITARPRRACSARRDVCHEVAVGAKPDPFVSP